MARKRRRGAKLSLEEIDHFLEVLDDGTDTQDDEIYGVEVRADSPRIRRVLHSVLDHIARRFPQDLDRIRRRVSHVAFFGSAEVKPGVCASYGDPVLDAPEYVPGPDGRPRPAAWPLKLARSLAEGPRWELVAVLAHELGHAVATKDEIAARSAANPGWGDELAADYHATRWGFGNLIDSMRSRRDVMHHGPLPGERVLLRFGPHERAWRVTADRILVAESTATRPLT